MCAPAPPCLPYQLDVNFSAIDCDARLIPQIIILDALFIVCLSYSCCFSWIEIMI